MSSSESESGSESESEEDYSDKKGRGRKPPPPPPSEDDDGVSDSEDDYSGQEFEYEHKIRTSLVNFDEPDSEALKLEEDDFVEPEAMDGIDLDALEDERIKLEEKLLSFNIFTQRKNLDPLDKKVFEESAHDKKYRVEDLNAEMEDTNELLDSLHQSFSNIALKLESGDDDPLDTDDPTFGVDDGSREEEEDDGKISKKFKKAICEHTVESGEDEESDTESEDAEEDPEFLKFKAAAEGTLKKKGKRASGKSNLEKIMKKKGAAKGKSGRRRRMDEESSEEESESEAGQEDSDSEEEEIPAKKGGRGKGRKVQNGKRAKGKPKRSKKYDEDDEESSEEEEESESEEADEEDSEEEESQSDEDEGPRRKAGRGMVKNDKHSKGKPRRGKRDDNYEEVSEDDEESESEEAEPHEEDFEEEESEPEEEKAPVQSEGRGKYEEGSESEEVDESMGEDNDMSHSSDATDWDEEQQKEDVDEDWDEADQDESEEDPPEVDVPQALLDGDDGDEERESSDTKKEDEEQEEEPKLEPPGKDRAPPKPKRKVKRPIVPAIPTRVGEEHLFFDWRYYRKTGNMPPTRQQLDATKVSDPAAGDNGDKPKPSSYGQLMEFLDNNSNSENSDGSEPSTLSSLAEAKGATGDLRRASEKDDDTTFHRGHSADHDPLSRNGGPKTPIRQQSPPPPESDASNTNKDSSRNKRSKEKGKKKLPDRSKSAPPGAMRRPGEEFFDWKKFAKEQRANR